MQADGLVYYKVAVNETDLYIGSAADRRRKAEDFIETERHLLEAYIARDPMFGEALRPVSVRKDAPFIAQNMAKAARRVGVGPMAAVAGAFAERLAEEVYAGDSDVIIENGGDIYLKTSAVRVVEIYAGESVFKGHVRLSVSPSMSPIGICTSSGKFGHSLSFGRADAACVLSQDAYLADAAATAVGNRVKSAADIAAALGYVQSVSGLTGASSFATAKSAYGGISNWYEYGRKTYRSASGARHGRI
jgi:ApbE superfamily uncharacterized protein (UPF0280 family)